MSAGDFDAAAGGRASVDAAEEEDLASEAIDFVRAAHAFIAWHEASGSVGFPRSEGRARPQVTHAEPDAPRAQPTHAEPSAPRAQATHAEPSAPRAQPTHAEAAYSEPAPAAQQASPARTFEPAHTFEPERPAEPKRALAEALPNLAPEERVRRLALIDERVQGCVSCGLHKARTRTVFSRGSPNAELCFVGEGPGEEEDRQGLPFVGKAGQLLDKMILAMGFQRDDVYVCNVVKCRPPDNRTPEAGEMATCLPYLNEQLDIVRPKAIVALGGTALKGLMGPSEGITKARGSWRLYRGQVPLMPTFHPAYILRQSTREVKAQVWSDLQQVLQRLGRKAPGRGSAD